MPVYGRRQNYLPAHPKTPPVADTARLPQRSILQPIQQPGPHLMHWQRRPYHLPLLRRHALRTWPALVIRVAPPTLPRPSRPFTHFLATRPFMAHIFLAGSIYRPDRVGTITRPDRVGTITRPDRAGTITRPDRVGTITRPDRVGTIIVED